MSELVKYIVLKTRNRKTLSIIDKKNTFPSVGDIVRTLDDELCCVIATGWCLDDSNEFLTMKAVLGEPIVIAEYYRKIEE